MQQRVSVDNDVKKQLNGGHIWVVDMMEYSEDIYWLTAAKCVIILFCYKS